jgi:TRAP transporter TAXI family solute receptor
MKAKPFRIAIAGAAAATVAVAGLAAGALAGELPKNMTWTAYGTTSSGYAQSVAIGNMLKNKHGTTLSIQPGKNDISRMTPLRDGNADFCACGIASYFGQEGVALFASAKWGPQPIRLLLSSKGGFGLALATAGDANVKAYKDLKGKRVAWVRGGDALNVGTSAYLAFGGLTWDDVEKVQFSGFGASWDGMVNGQVDAAFSSTPSPVTKKLAASPRGIHWPTLPHNDEAAWERFLTAAPYFVKHNATVGTGMSKDEPWEGATYAYPILVTNASYDADVVYSLVKAMVEGYEDYGGTVPGSKGWALESQGFEWVLPYHEGAIRYFKEVGVWTDVAQARTDALIARQGAIAEAWSVFTAASPPEDKGAFKTAWMAARAKALEGAGLDPIFK